MSNELSNLKPPKGAHKKAKRIGRGFSSGDGKTSGRGQKGQRARGTVAPWFEGGQMPLHRRLPKRGFTNIFAKRYTEVRLDKISAAFKAGDTVDAKAITEAGLVSKIAKNGIKVLGNGEIDKSLTVIAAKFTKSAKAKIEAAGGKVSVLGQDS
ncbi:MAG: 50S ribosomal protein L15 [Myxococcota bacterium]|nr:50S ribosomal protein L15 [Myxococcota bacterium]